MTLTLKQLTSPGERALAPSGCRLPHTAAGPTR